MVEISNSRANSAVVAPIVWPSIVPLARLASSSTNACSPAPDALRVSKSDRTDIPVSGTSEGSPSIGIK